jgi:large subunit ribosomal protein L18
MATGPRYHVQFRRRRQGKTDYRMRKKLISSGIPRAVVRCTSKNTLVQFVSFKPMGDEVLATATTMELPELGWKRATGNLPCAYLAGLMAGKRAAKQGITEAVLDIGRRSPKKGTKVFAALKGMLDAGISIAHDDEILPPEERISGAHINEELPKMFDAVLSKIKEAQ